MVRQLLAKQLMSKSGLIRRAKTKAAVIVCDAKRTEIEQLERLLSTRYHLLLSTTPMEALHNLMSFPVQSMILGLQRKDTSFRELIPLVKKLKPALPIIVIADGRSLEEQRAIQREGIFYFVPRPVADDEVLSAVANAVQKGLIRT